MISIVDDDNATRDSLRLLLDCVGFEAREFPSAEAFLELGN
jgi:FixJ family two-component response regulator